MKGKSVRGSHPRLLVLGLTQRVYRRSRSLTGDATKAQFRHLGMPYRLWCLPLVQKGHSGIRVRQFVGCIPQEILLFPVAHTAQRERIHVPAAVDYLRSLGETMTPYTAVRPPVSALSRPTCRASCSTRGCAGRGIVGTKNIRTSPGNYSNILRQIGFKWG
jgi:hypothetical protein